MGFFGAPFVPTRSTVGSALYDVFQVSRRKSFPEGEYTVRVTEVALGGCPSDSTTVSPRASAGSFTRFTGIGPVTVIVPGELTTRRVTPP